MNWKKNEKEIYSIKDIAIIVSVYCIVILIINLVWIMAIKPNEKFAETVSFASTLSSIILSVLAIIISIAFESRTGAIHIKMESEMNEIFQANAEMKGIIKNIKKNLKQLDTKTSNIQDFLINQNTINKNETGVNEFPQMDRKMCICGETSDGRNAIADDNRQKEKP